MSMRWSSVANDSALGSTRPANSNAVLGSIRGIRPSNGIDNAEVALSPGTTIAVLLRGGGLKRNWSGR
ncbi:hypothetical protein D3C83_163720 [compost metagenome]